jgi:hypothetical protein
MIAVKFVGMRRLAVNTFLNSASDSLWVIYLAFPTSLDKRHLARFRLRNGSKLNKHLP